MFDAEANASEVSLRTIAGALNIRTQGIKADSKTHRTRPPYALAPNRKAIGRQFVIVVNGRKNTPDGDSINQHVKPQPSSIDYVLSSCST
jgi:hypothetical protein